MDRLILTCIYDDEKEPYSFEVSPKCKNTISYTDNKWIVEKQENDWILCSERLPEELETVLVWYEYFRYGEYNQLYQTYGIGYYTYGRNNEVFWSGDVSGRDARCIAWMPLPKPLVEN